MAILARLRKIQQALHEYAESIRRAEESKGDQKMEGERNPKKVQVVVSFDEKTIADTTAQNEQTNATQESTKDATWAAFYAVAAYAVVTALMWCAMQEQNKIANRTLQQTRENFQADERAWIEIDPIKPTLLAPGDAKFSTVFTCNIQPKNVGKTSGRHIEVRAADVLSGDGWDSNASIVSTAQDMLFSKDMQDVSNSHVPSVLAPNAISPVAFRLTCQAPQTSASGHQGIHYLIGRMNYCDEFSIKHWLRFCYYVVNTRGEIWACKNGNNEDRNGETPTPETACEKPN